MSKVLKHCKIALALPLAVFLNLPGAVTASEENVTIPSSELARPKHLVACMDMPFVPMQYFSDEGEPTGLDVALIREVAKRLDLTPVFQNSDFSTIIPSLKAGKCDLIWADQYITPERRKQVTMLPYWRTKETLVVHQGNPKGVTDKDNLCGLTVAGQTSGVEIETLNELSNDCTEAGKEAITVRQYPKNPQALQSLLSNHVDVWMTSLLTATTLKSRGAVDIELLAPFTITSESGLVAISFLSETSPVTNAVVSVLGEMYEDGTYQEAFESYGLSALMLEPKL
jgi:ABC-type amino acid transport substrate-binding protein